MAERCVVVALAITADGTKIPVGLWDGSTENKTAARCVLADLVDRGLTVDDGLLVRRSIQPPHQPALATGAGSRSWAAGGLLIVVVALFLGIDPGTVPPQQAEKGPGHGVEGPPFDLSQCVTGEETRTASSNAGWWLQLTQPTPCGNSYCPATPSVSDAVQQ